MKYWQGKEGQEEIRVKVANGSKLPQVTVWCLRCDEMWMRDMEVIELTEDMEQTSNKLKKKKKKTIKKAKEQEVLSDLSLREARGEVTPPPTPRSKSRSPRIQAERFSRLLQFQQQLSEGLGLPTSHLQVRSRLEQVTTPSPSSPTSPCLRQGQRLEEETQEEVGEGRDLSGEFERIGAEALLLPLSTPVRVLPVNGGEGEGPQNQTDRYLGGRCSRVLPITSTYKNTTSTSHFLVPWG